MKGSRSTNNKQSKQGMSHKPVPEVRDNLDSRQNKEKGYEGEKGGKNDKLSRR